MRSVALRAPAKLNLHLGIYSQLDERRYHRADSLMAAIDLYDEVLVEVLHEDASAGNADDLPKVTCVPPVGIPPQKNTAFCAAQALAKRVNHIPNVHITICKYIPDQAGMGGSSSDAAAVLLALCDIWDINKRDERVFEAAQSVGADVPFFLDPVPTLLVGAGDVVEEKFAPLKMPVPVALVRPKGPGVSTPAAYAAFDKRPSEPADPQALCEVLRSGAATPEQIATHLANNLDPVACRLLPSVDEVRSWLLAQNGALGVQVTGSGSCVFAVCATDADAQRIAQNAIEMLDAWACATCLI